MSAPSKEEIAAWVRRARDAVAGGYDFIENRVIVALADENERLRAERAECLALLTDLEGHVASGRGKCGSSCVAPDDAELHCDIALGHEGLCQQTALRIGERGFKYKWVDNDKPRTVEQRRRALLAKLRGQP